jgi:hypothetical protein
MPKTEIARVIVNEPDTDCAAGWLHEAGHLPKSVFDHCDDYPDYEGCPYNLIPSGERFQVGDAIILYDDGSVGLERGSEQ